MTEKEALLEALLVERYARNEWWGKHADPPNIRRALLNWSQYQEDHDTDIACARRRKLLIAEADERRPA